MVLLADPEKPYSVKRLSHCPTFLLFAYLTVSTAFAQLRVSPVFSDRMLLQADKPIVVWGKGLPGKTVTARISNDQARTLVAADSTWELSLPKQKASGHPNRLIVAMEGETVALDDILFGDVWLCIGQSNMEWPMSREKHWDMEKAEADQPMIRFANPPPAGRYVYGVPYGDSLKDRLTTARFYDWDGWRVCDSQTVASMSAVAYYFAKRLRSDIDRPIGLINLSIGGAPLESFIGLDAMERHPRFQGKAKGDWLLNDSLPVWIRERGRQNVGGGNARFEDDMGPNHAFKPGFAYASGIASLSKMPIKGVLVYQGESNAEEEARVREYCELFRLMADGYRKAWRDNRLPFYWVQLSSIERPLWPMFRDVQRRLLDELDHVGMAVTSDVGMRNDVHPRDKRTVGETVSYTHLTLPTKA